MYTRKITSRDSALEFSSAKYPYTRFNNIKEVRITVKMLNIIISLFIKFINEQFIDMFRSAILINLFTRTSLGSLSHQNPI